jgi:uncharacterized membrane protein
LPQKLGDCCTTNGEAGESQVPGANTGQTHCPNLDFASPDFGFTLRATNMDLPSPARRTTAEIVPSDRLLTLGIQTFSALALVSFLLVLWTLITQSPLAGKPGWPEAVLVLTTALATVASLSRALPGQKVLLATVVIGLLGGLAHGIGAKTAYPFGPFAYQETAGPKFFNALAWPLPLIWIIAILNARGVARLILRPWRKLKNYAFWLIGLTASLVMLFDLALEPFAAYVNHFWLWQLTKFPFTWYRAPIVNFLGWVLTALLILAFTTPALTKKPARSKKNTTDYHPLIVWLLALTLFATSALRNQLWAAAGLCVLTGIVTAIFAVRGARW